MVKKKERAEKWSRRGLGTARDAQVLIRIRWTLAIVKIQKPHFSRKRTREKWGTRFLLLTDP